MFALNCLVEGCSIRSTERLTGLHRDTIMDLLVLAGERCERLMAERIQNVPAKAVQADEIWTFVRKKEKRRRYSERFNMKIGDAYTFVGIDADTKLVLCFELGRRDTPSTVRFMSKLDRATADRFQLTTDGFVPYVGAVEDQFGADIDFSQLVRCTLPTKQRGKDTIRGTSSAHMNRRSVAIRRLNMSVRPLSKGRISRCGHSFAA